MLQPTTSATLDIGVLAPGFDALLGTDGNPYTLASFVDAVVLVVVFVSNGCPTVRAYEDRLAAMQRRYVDEGVRFVAVNSNNPHLSPGDSYPAMVQRAEQHGYPFPYLKDEDGGVARAYGAICTPHAFVFDRARKLRYRGRVDDARDPARVTSTDLDDALRALVAGEPLTDSVTEPFGCSIVW